MDLPAGGHDPVLLNEVIEHLAPQPGQTVVDCTLGRAGHAQVIASRLGAKGRLIGLDVDERNLAFAKDQLAGAPCEVRLFHANFCELDEVMAQVGVAQVDGILADLGVSTNQLFDDAYGLSFAQDMPLDMRLDSRLEQSAADFVNHLPEDDLANVLYELAQERYSRRIARKIAEARRLSPITTTGRLADLVRSAIPRRGGPPQRLDPATRTFLALRIHTNREVQNLEAFLKAAPGKLSPGGRLAVISFQSVEDRLVKQAFRSAEQARLVKILTPKPLSPTDDEIARNPRSRSAKLRAIQRLV